MDKFTTILASFLIMVTSCISADIYQLDQEISGESPGSKKPWASVSIYSVDSNTLNIELNPFNLKSDSYMRYWYLNFTDKMDVNQLKFKTIGGNSNTEPSVSTGIDSFNVSKGGKFDIRVHFPEAYQQRFFGGESVLLEVTAVNPIDASMFNFGSYTKKSDESYYSALEVWGVGEKDEKGVIGSNSSVAVPEPSTYLMLGSLLALACLGRIFKRRKCTKETN